MRRRAVLAGALLAGAARAGPAGAGDDPAERMGRGIADLESSHGGRLGVAVRDPAWPAPFAHRGDERFALCSTYKFLAAAFVLARVDSGAESLARRIVYGSGDVVDYSPVTASYVGGSGLSLAVLCEAAMTLSDNTAGNLLLDSFGGPAALTAWLRSIGDDVTRLDRREPALNDVTPGDPRDTTTPRAMADVLQRTVLGTVLSPASRAQLAALMVANRTGGRLLRAGVPRDWRVGDKTGAGADNALNDIAVLWPPGREAIVVAAYYAGAPGSREVGYDVLSAVGRLTAATG